MMAQRLARRDWRSGGPRFKSHPRLTFWSWSSYQLNQLGSKAASDSTLKQLTTCGVSNTCTLLLACHFSLACCSLVPCLLLICLLPVALPFVPCLLLICSCLLLIFRVVRPVPSFLVLSTFIIFPLQQPWLGPSSDAAAEKKIDAVHELFENIVRHRINSEVNVDFNYLFNYFVFIWINICIKLFICI